MWAAVRVHVCVCVCVWSVCVESEKEEIVLFSLRSLTLSGRRSTSRGAERVCIQVYPVCTHAHAHARTNTHVMHTYQRGLCIEEEEGFVY